MGFKNDNWGITWSTRSDGVLIYIYIYIYMHISNTMVVINHIVMRNSSRDRDETVISWSARNGHMHKNNMHIYYIYTIHIHVRDCAHVDPTGSIRFHISCHVHSRKGNTNPLAADNFNPQHMNHLGFMFPFLGTRKNSTLQTSKLFFVNMIVYFYKGLH